MARAAPCRHVPYTIGQDIVFGAGEFQPETPAASDCSRTN